jgi:hypothetical protein
VRGVERVAVRVDRCSICSESPCTGSRGDRCREAMKSDGRGEMKEKDDDGRICTVVRRVANGRSNATVPPRSERGSGALTPCLFSARNNARLPGLFWLRSTMREQGGNPETRGR